MDRALNQIPALDPSDVEHGPVPIGPQVVDLEPLPDYRLRLAFSNGVREGETDPSRTPLDQQMPG